MAAKKKMSKKKMKKKNVRRKVDKFAKDKQSTAGKLLTERERKQKRLDEIMGKKPKR